MDEYGSTESALSKIQVQQLGDHSHVVLLPWHSVYIRRVASSKMLRSLFLILSRSQRAPCSKRQCSVSSSLRMLPLARMPLGHPRTANYVAKRHRKASDSKLAHSARPRYTVVENVRGRTGKRTSE